MGDKDMNNRVEVTKKSEELLKVINELNESAEESWSNEKIIELDAYKENPDNIELTLGIGKFDTSYHDVVLMSEGYYIKSQTSKKHLLHTFLVHFLAPIFYTYPIGEVDSNGELKRRITLL